MNGGVDIDPNFTVSVGVGGGVPFEGHEFVGFTFINEMFQFGGKKEDLTK